MAQINTYWVRLGFWDKFPEGYKEVVVTEQAYTAADAAYQAEARERMRKLVVVGVGPMVEGSPDAKMDG